MNLFVKNTILVKYQTIALILFGLIFSANGMAQRLSANQDNLVTIKVPGISSSKLIVTAKGGTIVRKKGTDQWIARPNGENDTTGVRKDFVITVSVNINGKNEALASKMYEVKKTHIIDYYDEETHRIKKDRIEKYDDVILRTKGKQLCFSISYSGSMGNTLPESNCDSLFTYPQKNVLIDYLNRRSGTGNRLILSITTVGKIRFSPIIITSE